MPKATSLARIVWRGCAYQTARMHVSEGTDTRFGRYEPAELVRKFVEVVSSVAEMVRRFVEVIRNFVEMVIIFAEMVINLAEIIIILAESVIILAEVIIILAEIPSTIPSKVISACKCASGVYVSDAELWQCKSPNGDVKNKFNTTL